MDGGLSMRSRAEVTTRYARAYVKAAEEDPATGLELPRAGITRAL